MRIRPLDTSSEAWRIAREAHARMGPEGRVRAAFEAAEFGRALALEGIRHRHPEYDQRMLRLALFRRLYGDALFLKAYPGENVVA
jgi:hypothetical protein